MKVRKFIDRHWVVIEEGIYQATACFVVGIVVIVFMVSLPRAIEQQEGQGDTVVAASLGVEGR